jgi:nitrate/nitrite transport system permease protein
VSAPAQVVEVTPRRGSPPARAARLQRFITRSGGYLSLLGMGWIVPVLRMAAGDEPRRQLVELWQQLAVPVLAIAAMLFTWGLLAPRVETSLGTVPGPAAVWAETRNLVAEHNAERERRDEFYARQRERNAAKLADNPDADVRLRQYTGKPTFLDQIFTSLETVFAGFVLATLIAVPVGVLAGLSKTVNAAVNPLVQLFKPVSPLAWLPIVTMVVSALYVSSDPLLPKSFVNSAITVTLCSLWPALINTALGVASIDRDLMNVGRVLQLGWFARVTKIVLPSALPLIFTGLRLSLGVGWMVLIAAEMLAQNPGLGKFVWDEFQNGSSSSLARILVAVFTIGIIGFLLDRVMLALQAAFTHGSTR